MNIQRPISHPPPNIGLMPPYSPQPMPGTYSQIPPNIPFNLPPPNLTNQFIPQFGQQLPPRQLPLQMPSQFPPQMPPQFPPQMPPQFLSQAPLGQPLPTNVIPQIGQRSIPPFESFGPPIRSMPQAPFMNAPPLGQPPIGLFAKPPLVNPQTQQFAPPPLNLLSLPPTPYGPNIPGPLPPPTQYGPNIPGPLPPQIPVNKPPFLTNQPPMPYQRPPMPFQAPPFSQGPFPQMFGRPGPFPFTPAPPLQQLPLITQEKVEQVVLQPKTGPEMGVSFGAKEKPEEFGLKKEPELGFMAPIKQEMPKTQSPYKMPEEKKFTSSDEEETNRRMKEIQDKIEAQVLKMKTSSEKPKDPPKL